LIVLDASATVEWLLRTSAGRHIEQRIYQDRQFICAPDLLDLEVAQALRRLARENHISLSRADEAIQDYLVLRIERYPHVSLVPRIWQLRHNLSAYDASYVALAETINATLITRDARLSRASGHTAKIELF
jgi:predicted nucleic acid-binding protein